jgi:NADH-quinone oxidoreductase subunit J
MDPVFLVSSALALLGAVMMVTRRNPVYSAVWLLVTFLSVAVIFLTLSAPFLAAIHVLVYTGAILVLFLFVIMLLNLREDEIGEEYPVPTRLGVAVMAAVLFGALAWPILDDATLRVAVVPQGEVHGSVEAVGLLMFRTYGLPFELVSVLIVVAMFGAMVLAKKRLTS